MDTGLPGTTAPTSTQWASSKSGNFGSSDVRMPIGIHITRSSGVRLETSNGFPSHLLQSVYLQDQLKKAGKKRAKGKTGARGSEIQKPTLAFHLVGRFLGSARRAEALSQRPTGAR